MICDIHSHTARRCKNTIISVSPAHFNPRPGEYYSVGIHPWDSLSTSPHDIELLYNIALHHQVVAIGECGIDRLKGGSMTQQIELLKEHITLAERVEKPLILHIVKGVDTLLALHKKYNPQQQWIVHGFRGNPHTALQLIDKGIALSYGEKYNKTALQVTPLDKLWIESDESVTDITEIYNRIAHDKEIACNILVEQIATRAQNLFFQPK